MATEALNCRLLPSVYSPSKGPSLEGLPPTPWKSSLPSLSSRTSIRLNQWRSCRYMPLALASLLEAENSVNTRSKSVFSIVEATSATEKLAAASLRAQIFYPHPEFRPITAKHTASLANQLMVHEAEVRTHIRERTRSEFFRDTKMQFLGMKVTCLLAVCNRDDHEISVPTNSQHSDSYQFMIEPPEVQSLTSKSDVLALGTLDVQVGKSLPGENLEGLFPSGDGAVGGRGYIFNLCVHPSARRLGVATSLMNVGAEYGRKLGLKVMYCHVEVNNYKAESLYKSLGYAIEQEEELEVEIRLKRCRRKLLRLNLVD